MKNAKIFQSKIKHSDSMNLDNKIIKSKNHIWIYVVVSYGLGLSGYPHPFIDEIFQEINHPRVAAVRLQ